MSTRAAATWGSFLVSVALGGCAHAGPPPPVAPSPPPVPGVAEPPWRTESPVPVGAPPPARGEWLVRGATVMLGDGTEHAPGHVAFRDGRVVSAGAGDGAGTVSATARVVEATGKFVTPGLIDTHSHLGVYPVPRARAHADGNEATRPSTPEVRAVDAIWPQDPGFERALRGGVTTLQVLPGSANLIGGRAVTLKLRAGASAFEMLFRGAPSGLKLACGENPKRLYGERRQMPSTRMGNVAGQREAFLAARALMQRWDEWRAEEAERQTKAARAQAEYQAALATRRAREAWCRAEGARAERRCAAFRREAEAPLKPPEPSRPKPPPARDPGLEALAGVLDGRVLVHFHCYRADDMVAALALADEMGFTVRSFHHALEAYKIRDELARRGVSVSTWADWWGFKMEAWDGIPENVALLDQAGVRAIVHSDSAEGIQRLNQEASKALWAGRHAGLPVPPQRALAWVTAEPAWALGVEGRVGRLLPGYDADLVVWSAHPLSVYARAERVFVDGVERVAPEAPSERGSDYEVEP